MNFRDLSVIVALTVVGVMCFAPLLREGWRSIRKQGLAFVLFSVVSLVSMATKPSGPIIEWDYGLTNNGSYFTTGGIEFKWIKSLDLPSDTPVEIYAALKPAGLYELKATTTAGSLAYALTLANATNYSFAVVHEYVPPTPVHTNGVWLGQILEKATDAYGLEKIVVIKGQIIENGKKLNP